jgi:release factor glutamine methyltransferase
MTVAERVAAARHALEAAGLPPDEARFDAELLTRTALGWDRATFFVNLRQPMDASAEPRLASLLDRRARREPAAYILGRQEFWGIDFEVTPAVLIPRPETEMIVEEALALYGYAAPPAVIADVCTGSGCLAVVLAREFNGASIFATDISAPALDVARCNAARHSVSGRVDFRAADLLDGVPGGIDLIVSNPPYVGLHERSSLQPEVLDNEPEVALFGGEDGLDVYRRLLPQARERLARRGHLIVEIGIDQRDPVVAIAEEHGFRLEHTRRDLRNITRTLVLSLE